MKSKKFIYKGYLLLLSLTFLLSSCIGEEPGKEGIDEYNGISEIYVTSTSPKKADGIGDDDTEETAPIYYDSFGDGSLLYFSQMPQGSNPNFEDETEEATSYLYVYEYSANPNANWNEGYNFKHKSDKWDFNWQNVLNIGPDGNAFKFFGFHYPVDNVIKWDVQRDQRGVSTDPYNTDNFLKSDILGAYHATSSLYTRMRFRLFHLMTYLKVTLYVPTYKGTADDANNLQYSGFNANAVEGGLMLNAYSSFTIDWAAAKSSDSEAPLVQIPSNARKDNIVMYMHQVTSSDPFSIKVRDYYGGAVDGLQDDGTDTVREYNFSVLFPTQNFGTDNFLCFALKTPGNDTMYYYFAGSQIIEGEGNNYGLTQGTLQQLYLYLPRKTNQTVLIGAKVLPWNKSVTDMTVNKQ